jgi:enoyl-CoA hydratase/carnithine racemase
MSDALPQAENLRLTMRDGVLEVVIDRPAARNALDTELLEALTDLARAVRLRPDVRAVILTGGPACFSAGADLRAVRARRDKPTLLDARRAAMAGPDLCKAWEEIEAVTIAAIEGYCIGGACALAAACDFRVMGRSAYLRLPETPLGINMSWRTLPRLVALMGPARTKAFVMFGEALAAPRCVEWGICDQLVEDGEALAAARGWAARVTALPPLPVRMTKEAVNAIAASGHHAAIYMDRDQYLLTTGTADHREAVQAFFERRAPRFEGR